MLKLCRRLDLSEKSFGAERGCQVRMKNLYRDVTLVPEVVSDVDRRHAARPDLARDAVAVRER